MRRKFALLGTITYDRIRSQSGFLWQGLGGVLYQAATFCALGEEVCLYTLLSQKLKAEVERITSGWPNFQQRGINLVPEAGNEVHLYYPPEGERVEILKSVVPPLKPDTLLKGLHGHQFEMLMAVFNSGFELKLKDWHKIVHTIPCSIWVDIHSLCLSRELNRPRRYVPIPEAWAWIEGVNFIQANAKEAASLLGHPQEHPSSAELLDFAEKAFLLGTKALFVTLGKEGVLVITPKGAETISAAKANQVVDTTGCGDVFGAATALKLRAGLEPVEAASFGLELASRAVFVRGIVETYKIIKDFQKDSLAP